MSCFGPLTQLSIMSTICPCVVSSGDSKVATSYNTLNTVFSEGVTWQAPKGGSSKEGGGFSVGSFLGTSPSSKKIKAHALVKDGPSGRSPVLEITPTDPKIDAVTVPFSKMGTFSLVGAGVSSWVSKSLGGGGDDSGSGNVLVIYGKCSDDSGQGGELIRCEVLDEENVVDCLTILLEWDRARRKNHQEEEEENEEVEEGSGEVQKKKGFLKTQADKAAHFAKREIEMRENRRDREQRKAKYLKEAGGLKYTAIAMANRA